jgi:hypothetical protein
VNTGNNQSNYTCGKNDSLLVSVGEILLGQKMAAVSEEELGQECFSEGLPSEQLGPAQNMKH